MESPEKYTEYLIRLKYPNISNLKDEEICAVYSPENRIFLLSWIITTSFDIDLTAKTGKELTNFIADIICNAGFCSSSQKLKFVNSEMPIPEMLAIFTRIFNFMLSLQNYSDDKPIDPQKSLDWLLEDIKYFVNKDLNLFPEYGPIKTRSDADRFAKINSIAEEIESLKLEISENTATGSSSNVQDASLDMDISKLLGEFTNSMSNFRENMQKLNKSNVPSSNSNYCFSSKFKENIANCSDKVEGLVECIDCIEGLKKFQKSQKEDTDSEAAGENALHLTKTYCEISNELTNLKNQI